MGGVVQTRIGEGERVQPADQRKAIEAEVLRAAIIADAGAVIRGVNEAGAIWIEIDVCLGPAVAAAPQVERTQENLCTVQLQW